MRARLLPPVLACLLSMPALAAGPDAVPPAAQAASAPVGTADTTAAPAEPAPGVAEKTRKAVSDATLWLARTVDSWFGNQPFSEGGSVSDGRLHLTVGQRQGENPDVNLRFGARMRLPNVERHGYFFVGRDDPREVVSDTPNEVSRQQVLIRQNAADPSFFAGFGVTVRDAVDFRIGFRGGLNPYAQARYRHAWVLSPVDLVDFRETVFLSADDRLGSTTTLSYSHGFSPTLHGRWFNSATITQESRVLEWSSILGAYQSFGLQRLLSLEAILSGEEGSPVPVSDYGLQLKWEQPIHKDWLLAEVIVGHFWPRDDAFSQRGREWAVGVGLKLTF